MILQLASLFSKDRGTLESVQLLFFVPLTICFVRREQVFVAVFVVIVVFTRRVFFFLVDVVQSLVNAIDSFSSCYQFSS